jgi:hypothetical protein
LIAGCEQGVKLIIVVCLRLFFRVPRPVVFARQTTNPVRLQKRHDVLEFVVDGARGLFLFVTEKCGELEQVFAVNLFEVELWAGLSEVSESSCVCGQRLRLLGELSFVKEVRDGGGY